LLDDVMDRPVLVDLRVHDADADPAERDGPGVPELASALRIEEGLRQDDRGPVSQLGDRRYARLEGRPRGVRPVELLRHGRPSSFLSPRLRARLWSAARSRLG